MVPCLRLCPGGGDGSCEAMGRREMLTRGGRGGAFRRIVWTSEELRLILLLSSQVPQCQSPSTTPPLRAVASSSTSWSCLSALLNHWVVPQSAVVPCVFRPGA